MAPPAMDFDVRAVTDTTGITIPNPLSIHGIPKRRTAAGKMNAGVAAMADVESFKGSMQHGHKPLAKRWDSK